MEAILVVAELDPSGRLCRTTLSAITFAQRAAAALGGSYAVLVLGGAALHAAEELTSFGPSRVLCCEDPTLANYLAERYAPTVAEVAKGHKLIVATASSFGKDLLPRVAARLGAAYAADCADVRADNGKLVFKRPMYAGNALGYCTLETPIGVASVRQTECAPSEPSGGRAPIERIPCVAPGEAAARIEFVSLDAEKSERPELGEARRVVAGGRALKDRFSELLVPLADVLGAAIGASRAAVDGGFAPGTSQVGQTGKVVAPELYIAVGISGAIQHVAGIRGSKTIVAINKDPEAPIFALADYGLVADLYEALPELVARLAERKRAAG
jgi:electron transfer flavoprotein alpha subunit